jgi:hypothetical protein
VLDGNSQRKRRQARHHCGQTLKRDPIKWTPFFGKIELEQTDADQGRFVKK